MDFIDQLRLLSSRIATIKDMVQTEEATKNSMIMPLIQSLGYNVFDPTEVTPELVADIGTKKGEKVDYAILQDGKPIMLFECKKSGGDLSINHAAQLFRYFHVTEARFGVLTNGLKYRFFTDLEQPNKMDEIPFFEFNILDFKDQDVAELKKFAKSNFDVDSVLNTANELKYTRALQQKLSKWMSEPSEDFVRLLCSDLIGSKRFTSTVKDQFTQISIRAFEQLVGDKINERLKGAMTIEKPALIVESSIPRVISEPEVIEDKKVETSKEEVEAFYIIKSILRGTLDFKRVFIRDALSYCAILIDDNNRKPLCRLRFNNLEKMSIGIFDNNKEEKRYDISTLDEIYLYSEQLKASASAYLVDEKNTTA